MKLTSHFLLSTPFMCIQSAIQLTQINTALLQPCYLTPA